MAHVMVFGTRVSLPSQPGLRCLSVSLARPSTFSLGVADGFQPRRCMYFHPRHRSELGACRRGARAGGGWRVSSHGGSLQGPRGGRRADPPVCSTPTHREGGGEPSGAPSRRPLPVATRRGGGGGRSHAPRTRAVPIYWGGGDSARRAARTGPREGGCPCPSGRGVAQTKTPAGPPRERVRAPLFSRSRRQRG